MPLSRTAFLFDLDGTLVDSVYQHVLAWHEALQGEGISLPVWQIHRKIGMSGGLFTNMLLREIGVEITTDRLDRMRALHAAAFRRLGTSVRPLPGAVELLRFLTDRGVPWAIATSGRMETAAPSIASLGVDPTEVPVVTRDQVQYAKPDPDLFLAAADRLGHPIEDAFVVGDSIWDVLAARRAKALAIGLLTGGYGEDELERSGAFRVFDSPADLLNHIDEVGVRR
ncbi:HAD family hydrolase [Labrys wisconsinensis]|uniref:HAD superfamily hydrolase (TIGR01509 family) n=1 Tax=Labrys wisconsinensis TaxID=425677 RepID=A0ABU0JQD0_9HYPH|nr:HAD family hydrolase [Labrys wisconsinensis]MDQ0475352.1 HAD superfamily hydrolase (TIGR01509 family) [Labrys wisconsinensis]